MKTLRFIPSKKANDCIHARNALVFDSLKLSSEFKNPTKKAMKNLMKNKQTDFIAKYFKFRSPLGQRACFILSLLGLLIPFAAWWLLSHAGLVEKVFMPSPEDVLKRSYEWLLEGNLLADIGISMFRVLCGFIISAIIALPIALMIGCYRSVQAFFEPITDFIRYMPAVAFIPLVMIWVGIDEGAKISIIFIGTFFQMVLMMAEDIRRVPMAQIEAAQTMGASRGELTLRVILQSAKPALLDTMRITMGWAWSYLVVAEIVAANSGLGYAILKAQRFLQTDKIFAGILIIGLIGLLMDQGFRWLHRKSFPWLYFK